MQVAKPKKGYKLVKWYYEKNIEIPEEWDVEQINQISKIVTSGVKKYNGQKEYVQTGDIADNEIVSSTKYSHEKRPSRANMEVEIGDVLFAKMKDTVKVLIISKKENNIIFSTGFAVLRSKKQKVSSQYLRYYVESINFQKFKNNFSEGGTQVAINQKNFSKLNVLLPKKIEEQQKIASILSNVNYTLQKTNQIIDQTQHLKKGIMQKLLISGIGHSKFKKVKWYYGKNIEIPEEWKIFALEKICVYPSGIQTGPFGSLLHKSDYREKGIPIITVKHLGDNFIIHNNLPLVSSSDYKRLKKFILREGDIVFSRVGSTERRAIVTKQEEGWLFSGRCLRVRPNIEMADSFFMSWFFDFPLFKIGVHSVSVGSTMDSLNTKLLSQVKVIVPLLSEQKQIASIISNVATQIQKEKLHKSNLERLKKGLIRKLLTGQIRVKV